MNASTNSAIVVDVSVIVCFLAFAARQPPFIFALLAPIETGGVSVLSVNPYTVLIPCGSRP